MVLRPSLSDVIFTKCCFATTIFLAFTGKMSADRASEFLVDIILFKYIQQKCIYNILGAAAICTKWEMVGGEISAITEKSYGSMQSCTWKKRIKNLAVNSRSIVFH